MEYLRKRKKADRRQRNPAQKVKAREGIGRPQVKGWREEIRGRNPGSRIGFPTTLVRRVSRWPTGICLKPKKEGFPPEARRFPLGRG